VLATLEEDTKTISGKRNSEQRTLTERPRALLRMIVTKNHRSTAAHMIAELNIHLEDPVST
jgi:hypothetical protein